ncbi:unnamed protein product [Jaminaea pallidilutea]
MKASSIAGYAAVAGVYALSATAHPTGQQQAWAQPAAPMPFSAPSLIADLWHQSVEYMSPRLVQTAHDASPYYSWPLLLRWRGVPFMDVTDHGELGLSLAYAPSLQSQANFPNRTHYSKEVEGVHANITQQGPREHIKAFTSFRNRYYRSATGRQSQLWLLETLKGIVNHYDRSDITVEEFKHSWDQASIILRIPAKSASDGEKAAEAPAVVVGCHQDSVNLILPILPAPGADDDGSGVVTQLESLRSLLAQGFVPKDRPVEYHFYSAEEGGLLGSQAVVESYVRKSTPVYAMSQFDMTAYVKKGSRDSQGRMKMGIVEDFVSPELTAFNRLLLKSYLDDTIVPVSTKLGYAGSDHASWNKVGVPSSFTIENAFEVTNHEIHSTRDVWDREEYSFDLIEAFSKLSTAFIVELAGWA